MTKPPTGAPDRAPSRTAGLYPSFARLTTVLGFQVVVLLVAVMLAAAGGDLPVLTADAVAAELLPVSAAMGLLLACRRLDLSIPALFTLAAALRANPWAFSSDPVTRLGILAGACAGLGLAWALVTWFGRISSALWTGLVAMLWIALLPQATPPLLPPAHAGWEPGAAAAAALGLMAVGAALLGLAGLVVLPSRPPILPTGKEGLVGLALAWMLAGAGIALAAASDTARQAAANSSLSYLPPLAAAALSGAYILRGRWGAFQAVVLACTGHLVLAYVTRADLGDRLLDPLLPVAAALAAMPVYLVVDAAIRRRTHESAPTGLLA